IPSRASRPCTPAAGALRGAPASTTPTDRRERASIKAPFSPAAPPPTTTTSYSFFNSSVTVTTSAVTVRRTAPDRQGSLPLQQSPVRRGGASRPAEGAVGAGPAGSPGPV